MKKEAKKSRWTWATPVCGVVMLTMFTALARAAGAPNYVAEDAKPGMVGKAVETAATLVDTGDYENGCALAISATKARNFQGLRRVQRRAAWGTVLDCGFVSKNTQLVHESLTIMTAEPGADVHLWLYRLGTAIELQNFDDAALVVATMLERKMDLESKLTEQPFQLLVISLLQKLRHPERSRLHERVLETIHDADSPTFQSDEVLQSEWRLLALRLIQRGDLVKAIKVAQRIVTARDVIAMRSDKRFDPIVTAIPEQFDLAAIVSRALSEMRAKATQVPRTLLALRNIAQLMEPEEALKATQHAVDCITSKKPCYDDQFEYYVSIFAVRLSKLMRLGRREESISTLALIETYVQSQVTRADRVIFLATKYLELDLPQDAARILTWNRLPPFDPDEEAELQLLMVAGALAVGDRPAAERAAAAFSAPHLSMSRHHQNALVLLGREDAAATLLIDRLRSDEARGEALYQLQTYRTMRGSDFFTEFHTRWSALKAREDVRRVASEVGRIESYAVIHPIAWSSEQPFFMN